ncbi:MAG: glycerophosphodiester phosphodiesterase [Acidobacteriia bacterium]|nr:glycerophosphodiester phosphodiesterase [Terriglobia bacterium]
MLTSLSTVEGRPLVHGHRGARAVLPENSLPAFEYAISIGVDVLELDLAVTRDDVLVVSHDPTLNPQFCRGPAGSRIIRELTFAQLRQWDCGAVANPDFPRQKAVPGTKVPSLDEVLALAPKGQFEFNIETKIFRDRPQYTPAPQRFAQLLVDAIRKHNLSSRVMIQSFDFRTLHAAKALAPEIRRSALYSGPPRDLIALTREAEANILSPEFRLVTEEMVRAAHQAGFTVVPWTANTPGDWKRLLDAGVDAIISDDPAALIAFLKK